MIHSVYRGLKYAARLSYFRSAQGYRYCVSVLYGRQEVSPTRDA